MPAGSGSVTELLLIRHGETDWNIEGRIQGHLDIALNQTGLAQARALGERFRDEHIDVLVSSDLMRAMQTAQPIASSRALHIRREPQLRERNLGVLQGLTPVDARRQVPGALENLRSRASDQPLEAGETLREFATRAVDALLRLATAHAGKRIAVVTHGGVLDAAYRYACGTPLETPRDFPVFNASVNTLRFDGSRLSVIAWADLGHLPPDLAMDDT